jgi:gluconokinase
VLQPGERTNGSAPIPRSDAPEVTPAADSPAEVTRAPLVVVMGVAGSGKTSVGEALARRLGVDYADADWFHGKANVAKMSAGQPLEDRDRSAWLQAVGRWLSERDRAGGVVSCSALRRGYRDILRAAAPRVTFLHLDGDPHLVAERVAERTGHFMPASLVTSQLETLEPLEADESGVRLDFNATVDDIVADFTSTLTPGSR